MITASPDIIQLDKWSVEDVKAALDLINAQDKKYYAFCRGWSE